MILYTIMLRGFSAPTDFLSRNKDPSVSPETKLEMIKASPVVLSPWVIKGNIYDDTFNVTLPFTEGGCFYFRLPSFPETLLSDYINVGDADLYGHGIGSRLLRAACRFAVEQSIDVCEFHTNAARLGAVNMAVSVFGEENVAVLRGGKQYGWEGSRALDSVFDDFPPTPEKPYLVDKIAARINRDLAMSWEMPIYTMPDRQKCD